jgi:hypothetical protein
MVTRISAREARQQTETGQAVLVCAYDDEQKCRDAGVTGSITHREFQTRLSNLPKNREIIFFCG